METETSAAAAATAAASAQCHYREGRLSRSIEELERWEKLCAEEHHKLAPVKDKDARGKNDGWPRRGDCEFILADDNPDEDEFILSVEYPLSPVKRRQRGPSAPARAELVALPPLARVADLAMCRFRLAMSSGAGEEQNTSTEAEKSDKKKESNGCSDELDDSCVPCGEQSASKLWREALEANRDYRQAVKGASMSLVHTCNVALEAQSRWPKVTRRTKEFISIEKAMKSTTLAILMAGIAASHLHLYGTEKSAPINYSITISKDDAWSVLVDAAVLAADLMHARNEWMEKINSNAGKGPRPEANIGARPSLLEGSMCILNKTLCDGGSQFNGKNDHDHNWVVEDERGSVAMHSFRSTLKVAALATGRLVLPKLPLKENELHREERFSRREKVKESDEKDGHMRGDGWNAEYLHSCPLLRSRDWLMDALSFHLAAVRYPNGGETLIGMREACFFEAVEWENRAGVLYDTDEMEHDGRAGFAWKMRNCIRGIELASSPRDHAENGEWSRTLQSLELLASSSSSQFACDLLGCIHAGAGDFSRAITNFQLSLDRGEGQIPEANEDAGAGSAQHRTLVNMALCFLSMGEADTPLELLLHLWTTLSETWSPDSNAVRSMALSLSSSGNEIERSPDMSLRRDCSARMELLWKLFHVSSLAQDWGTCLSSTEEMSAEDGGVQQSQTYCIVARVFALLQCRRPSAGLEITQQLDLDVDSRENEQGPRSRMSPARLLLVLAKLYHADASLLTDQSGRSVGNEIIPLDCTQSAIDAVDSLVGEKEANWRKMNNSPLHEELLVTVYNDHGISLLMAGDSLGALHWFREATNHTSFTRKIASSWLLLPSCFNLSLLLLRDGHTDDSAKSWLHLRGHLPTWQEATSGSHKALRKLRSLRVVAANRHGLLMAKRGMQGGAGMWDQETVVEWAPPAAEQGEVEDGSARLCGVEASQVTALDVVLLRYAVSHAERKASSFFRRGAGHIGY